MHFRQRIRDFLLHLDCRILLPLFHYLFLSRLLPNYLRRSLLFHLLRSRQARTNPSTSILLEEECRARVLLRSISRICLGYLRYV